VIRFGLSAASQFERQIGNGKPTFRFAGSHFLRASGPIGRPQVRRFRAKSSGRDALQGLTFVPQAGGPKKNRLGRASKGFCNKFSCNICPAFHRFQTSVFCAGEGLDRFPWVIDPKKISSYCIDLSNAPRSSGLTLSISFLGNFAEPIRLEYWSVQCLLRLFAIGRRPLYLARSRRRWSQPPLVNPAPGTVLEFSRLPVWRV